MPRPELRHADTRMACRFEGSATEVRIEGVGPVKLSADEAFSKPFAARVKLSGARINGAGPHVWLDPAGELEPVDVDLVGGSPPYKAIYRAAPDGAEAGFTLTIDEGGAKGHVRGAVPKAPECAGKDWCDVTWEGGPKGVTVTPAPGTSSVTVTGSFPFRKSSPADLKATSKVVSVTALGARGTLVCDDHDVRSVNGEALSWQAPTSGPLGVEPVVWEHGRLKIIVTSEHPPPPPSRPWPALAALVALAVLCALALARFVGRRRSDRDRRPPAAPVDLFYSYVPEDAALLQKLVSQLRLLEKRGLMRGWHRGLIEGGKPVREQIDEHLERARVVLLLVSADYVASEEAYGAEMKRALERHEDGSCVVLPVLLRPVAGWHDAPFGKLAPLPSNGRPVTDKSWGSLDDALADVAAGVERAIASLPREGALKESA
jgi:TIR domain